MAVNIPKIIHYCWFGRQEKPEKVKKCIESWEKFCPDYQIICWNEDNYKIESKCAFVQEAYRAGKWAFVSDYARIEVVYEHGGVYLDTDVELLKPLDDIICQGAYAGFEDKAFIATGLGFAGSAGDKVLKRMLERYHELVFDVKRFSDIKCPVINTAVFREFGLITDGSYQELACGWRILPQEYLCPMDLHTGKCRITENTISIHHYDASWQSSGEYHKNRLIIGIKKILPEKLISGIQHLIRSMRRQHG